MRRRTCCEEQCQSIMLMIGKANIYVAGSFVTPRFFLLTPRFRDEAEFIHDLSSKPQRPSRDDALELRVRGLELLARDGEMFLRIVNQALARRLAEELKPFQNLRRQLCA